MTPENPHVRHTDIFEPSPTETWVPESHFYSFSAKETVENEEKLKKIFESDNALPWRSPEDKVTPLAVSSRLPHSGETKPVLGIVGVNSRLLKSSTDLETAKVVAIHEGVHAQVGGDLRRHLQEVHPDIHFLLHDVIIKEWKAGLVEMDFDERFIDGKGWQSLSQNSVSYGVSIEDAKQIMSTYFEALKKGFVNEFRGDMFVESPFSTISGVEEFKDAASKDIALMYKEDPKKITKFIMTGYEIGERLCRRLRDSKSGKIGRDLWSLEENYANYVCSVLGDTTVDNFVANAPQDPYKFDIAKKLQQKDESKDKALKSIKSVTDYDSMLKFFEEEGM